MTPIPGSGALSMAATPFLPTGWSVVSAFAIAVAGGMAMVSAARRLGHSGAVGAGLYAWHTFFCLAFAWYVLNFGGDANGYYARAVSGGSSFALGTPAVDVLASWVMGATGTSFVGVSLAFNLAGSIGLLLLYDVLRSVTSNSSGFVGNLVWPVVLMPSASFWSAGLGKDSLAFLAAALLAWSAVVPTRRLGLVASILIMFVVRPHMAGLILAMLLVSAVGAPRQRLGERVVHAFVVGAVIVFALPVVLNYVGLGGAQTLDDVGGFIEQRQQYNQGGEAGIDISRLPVPMQIATYLFRPLPHEAWSIFALMASAEVLFLLALAGLAVHRAVTGGPTELSGRSMFLWLYVAGGTYSLATTTANLGIAVRQKWMLMPALLVLLLANIARRDSRSADEYRLGGHRSTRAARRSVPASMMS